MRFIISLLINALILYAGASLLSGVTMESYWVAIVAAIVLSLLNLIVGPVLKLLTLPLTFLTFGLFLLVINGLIVMMASSLVGGFEVASLGWGIGYALLITIFNALFNSQGSRKRPQ
jgi:putative membrane protein